MTPWAEVRTHDNGSAPFEQRRRLASGGSSISYPGTLRPGSCSSLGGRCSSSGANRTWLSTIRDELPLGWVSGLQAFPPSLRKLEWNCQGEERELWKHLLQFRPSGLRVKRYANSPSLVAMTSTQIPILGPERRHLSRVEGLRLQGFPDDFNAPTSRVATFKALGNAVHMDVAYEVARRLLDHRDLDPSTAPEGC